MQQKISKKKQKFPIGSVGLTKNAAVMSQLCIVNYGSHLGEYIRYKLDTLGIKQSWLAKQIQEAGGKMSKPNLSKMLSNKAELLPSEMEMIGQHLPNDFFDEFYKNNPKLRPYQPMQEPASPEVKEAEPHYRVQGSGYRITLEIDPFDFNPDYVKPLSQSLENALRDFHSRIKEDQKRTK